MAVVIHILKNDIKEETLKILSNTTCLPPDMSPPPPIYAPTRYGLSLTLILAKEAVMIKLNAITTIDKEYRRTIKFLVDLYQEKNIKDNHIIRAAAVP